ncbi:hypothetical protein RHSIM_Rhsim05G0117700 [Rhododendron simsii]|uniref:Uncharacterized protein n=1 Tax=Rhododendron simsii TaxID=118357 RepID=A0A834LNK0_RHOSS|nr:hypothetical protein RHSIM_Rhsim05G0117700 [Rhododendron simsii]
MEANGARYLGLLVFHGNSKRDLYSYVKDNTIKRLRRWKDNQVNHAGREVLLKSVVLPLPNYAISCFRLRKTILQQISSEVLWFWWGSKEGERKIHWIKWDKLSLCKGDGGLGLRDMESFNKVLLAK